MLKIRASDKLKGLMFFIARFFHESIPFKSSKQIVLIEAWHTIAV